MDTHELKIVRGAEAQQLLAGAMFNQAFIDTRQALLNTWASLDTTDERYGEFAKDLHRKIKCLDMVKRALVEHVNTGKVAQKEVDGRSRLKRFIG